MREDDVEKGKQISEALLRHGADINAGDKVVNINFFPVLQNMFSLQNAQFIFAPIFFLHGIFQIQNDTYLCITCSTTQCCHAFYGSVMNWCKSCMYEFILIIQK